MPETIKRITINDLNDKLAEWNLHNTKRAKFFLVNDIDIFDLEKSLVKQGLYFSGESGKKIFMWSGTRIIRSEDIPHGEIYVV